MALRIIRSSEPLTVEHLVLCVYGAPGVGKTSLAFSAEKALLLDFDCGAHRAANRGDIVSVSSWSDAGSISGTDLDGYNTLIVDTAGRALDSLTAEIIQGNPKLARSGGALTLQGYGELKSRFIAFTKLIRSFGLDIILLAHSDEQRGNGDDLIERIDVQGGSKNEIYKAADVMGRLRIMNGQRLLNFSPTDTAFGKNPAGLGELAVPAFVEEPNFLAGVISGIKASLNRLTADQRKTANLLTVWQETFDAVAEPDALNALIPEVASLDMAVRDNIKRLLVKVGKSKGWEWDKDAKNFRQIDAFSEEGGSSTAGGQASERPQQDFNPLSRSTADGITSKQTGQVLRLAKKLNLRPDDVAAKLFRLPVALDDLSQPAASMLIADLTARAESAGDNL